MEYGTIRIKLDELLKESGLSKNMLSYRAEMQRTQLNNYCKNQITRLDMLSFPGLTIYPSRRKVFLNQQEVKLTVKEYEILLLLTVNHGCVLTYNQIYETVWGDFATGSESNCIGFHICNLRKKLHTTLPDTTFRIASAREIGYCFEIQAEK